MTRRKKLEALRRRRDFLRGRIEAFEDTRGTSYDRAEVAALSWAIEELEESTAPVHPLAHSGDLDAGLQAVGIDPFGNAP